MTQDQQAQTLQLLEALRGNLQQDGGDLEFLRFDGEDGNTVVLKLVGHWFIDIRAILANERILKEQVSQEITVEREE